MIQNLEADGRPFCPAPCLFDKDIPACRRKLAFHAVLGYGAYGIDAGGAWIVNAAVKPVFANCSKVLSLKSSSSSLRLPATKLPRLSMSAAMIVSRSTRRSFAFTKRNGWFTELNLLTSTFWIQTGKATSGLTCVGAGIVRYSPAATRFGKRLPELNNRTL